MNEPDPVVTPSILPGAAEYRERRNAMTEEEKKQLDKAAGVASVVGVGLFFPGVLGGVVVVALLIGLFALFALFTVISPALPLIGLLAPTILLVLMWQTEFRPFALRAVNRLFSGMLGQIATEDKRFTIFILGSVWFVIQLIYGIIFLTIIK